MNNFFKHFCFKFSWSYLEHYIDFYLYIYSFHKVALLSQDTKIKFQMLSQPSRHLWASFLEFLKSIWIQLELLSFSSQNINPPENPLP